MSNGIRNRYSEMGVEAYYRAQGDEYVNPHFEQVRELLFQNESRLDYSRALDFCCGSGEVTLALRELGYETAAASDPFTAKAFLLRTGRSCLPHSFDDVIRGRLEGDFSCIISSFALHLCPEEKRFPLAYQLLRHSTRLVVITPHKQPAFEDLEGIRLQFSDFALTPRGKKVFLKVYAGFLT